MKPIFTMVVLCSGVWSMSATVASEPGRMKGDADATPGDLTKASDSWRFKFYQGNWWYWLPTERWAVYENGRWLTPPEQAPAAEAHSQPAAKPTGATQENDDGSFAEDYPAVPVGSESAKQLADHYLLVGGVFSQHAHEHAKVLEKYAASGDTVPARIVRDQVKAIHHDVDRAQKAFSQVSVVDEEAKSTVVPDTVKNLQVDLHKVTESLRGLESQVQKQSSVQSTLVRSETAVISGMLKQANESAALAERVADVGRNN